MFPFPNPLPKPVGADQRLYWEVYGACLAASWALARGDLAALDRLIDVVVAHTQMRAQARSVGLTETDPEPDEV